MLQGQQRTLPHWIDDIHAQQTISMGFSKYRRSHTIIFFIILMNEKGVSISVYLENKTTIIRLSPCVHITFWAVTFRFLWMLTSYVTGGCCHISVVSGCYGSPLKTKSVRKDGSKCRKIDLVLFSGALLVSCSSGGFGGVFPYARGGDRCAEPESDSVIITLTIVYIHQSPQSDISHWHTHWICIGMIGHAWPDTLYNFKSKPFD